MIKLKQYHNQLINCLVSYSIINKIYNKLLILIFYNNIKCIIKGTEFI